MDEKLNPNRGAMRVLVVCYEEGFLKHYFSDRLNVGCAVDLVRPVDLAQPWRIVVTCPNGIEDSCEITFDEFLAYEDRTPEAFAALLDEKFEAVAFLLKAKIEQADDLFWGRWQGEECETAPAR